jgi:hypothetical protein
MSIEKLKECKVLAEDAVLSANFRIILNCVIDSTIDLLERDMKIKEITPDTAGAKKWRPISEGFYLSSSGECVEFDMDNFYNDGNYAIDMGFICKTEKQAQEKHKQLRAYSRLQSLVMEYGEFDCTGHDVLYYPVYSEGWFCNDTTQYSPIEIYHTEEVIEEVCRLLNLGEVEL